MCGAKAHLDVDAANPHQPGAPSWISVPATSRGPPLGQDLDADQRAVALEILGLDRGEADYPRERAIAGAFTMFDAGEQGG
jgi:hypothetical protein